MKSSLKQTAVKKETKKEVKKSSRLTHWPKDAEERKQLYNKYASGRERLSYQFLDLMMRGEDIFKGVSKQVLKRAYLKADEIGDSKSEGLITRKEFPYFLKYLMFFTDLWKAFEKMDDDKNNRLTLDEFMRNRAVLEKDMNKQRAESLFKQMDKDAGGSISFDEFCNWGLEQPAILQYDNKFFEMDPKELDEDEQVSEEKEKVKIEEEVKVVEEQDIEIEENDDRDKEIEILKAKIIELELENQELQKKLLFERVTDNDKNRELERMKLIISDLEKKMKDQKDSKSDEEKIRKELEIKVKNSEETATKEIAKRKAAEQELVNAHNLLLQQDEKHGQELMGKLKVISQEIEKNKNETLQREKENKEKLDKEIQDKKELETELKRLKDFTENQIEDLKKAEEQRVNLLVAKLEHEIKEKKNLEETLKQMTAETHKTMSQDDKHNEELLAKIKELQEKLDKENHSNKALEDNLLKISQEVEKKQLELLQKEENNREKLEKERKEKQLLEEEINRLKSSAEKQSEDSKKSENEKFMLLQVSLAQENKENNDLKESLKKLQAECEKSKLEGEKHDQKLIEQLKEYQDKIEKESQTNIALEKNLLRMSQEEEKRIHDPLENEKENKEKLEKEKNANKQLEEEISKLKELAEKHLEDSKKTECERCKLLAINLAQVTKEKNDLEDEMKQFDAKIEKIKAESNERLNDCEERCKRTTESKKEVEEEQSKIKKKILEDELNLEMEVSKKIQENEEQYAKRIKFLEEALLKEQKGKHFSEIKIKENEESELKKQVAELEQMKLNEAIKTNELLTKIKSLEKNLSEMKDHYESEHNQLNKGNMILQGQMEENQVIIKGLQEKIRICEQTHISQKEISENKKKETENEEIKNKIISNLEKNVKKLEESLKETKQENEAVNTLNKKLQEFDSKKDADRNETFFNLEKKIKELEYNLDMTHNKEMHLDNLKKEVEQFNQAMFKPENTRIDLEKKINDLGKEFAHVKDKVESEIQQLSDLKLADFDKAESNEQEEIKFINEKLEKLKKDHPKTQAESKEQDVQRELEPFSDVEKEAFCILISNSYKDDEHLKKIMPINPKSKVLFEAVAKTPLLSKMILKADPNAIDINKISLNDPLEPQEIESNLVMSLNAMTKLNCDMKNIDLLAFTNQVPDLILKTLWETLQADLKNQINPNKLPELNELKQYDEDSQSFLKIDNPEIYILRWINHHLKHAGYDKEVKNFESDLMDGLAYTLLLNELEPLKCDTFGLNMSEEERIIKVLKDSTSLGVPPFLSPNDVLSGNKHLNLLFCAEILKRNNGLEPKKTFVKEEKCCFVKIINNKLKEVTESMNAAPLNPNDNSLFNCLKDGVTLCKLVNDAVPGTIDPRAINIKEPLNALQIKENLTLALSSAKAIGCKVDNVSILDIAKGKEHEVLDFLYQIFKTKAQTLNVKDHPSLLCLKKKDEEIGDLLKLSPEDMLKRWVNFHLKNAGNEIGIKNFGEDLADCKNFTLLLHQLDPKIDKSGLNDDLEKRAIKVLLNTESLGVEPFVSVPDLLSANPKINFLYMFEIFSKKSGLSLNEEEKFEAAELLKDDVGDSREERSFRMWINSLKIPDQHLNNLFEDIRDGLVLLKVLDRIEPGCVDWKKAEMKPNHRLKKIHNANYAVDIGKNMKFSLVGIGGIDLVDCKKKLVLALIWQMVRKHTLQVLGGWNEDKLLHWALERVNKEPKINSFKDKSIANCHFLFNLLASIEPNVINWNLVTPGNTPEEVENNCNYVLSVARKLGATIFLVWEDIKNVNPKMIMTLFAALVKISKFGKQEEMIDFNKKSNADI